MAAKELPKVYRAVGSRTHVDRRSGTNETVRQNLSPPFKAKEEESVLTYLGNRPAERTAELMLVMALSRSVARVELEGIGVQDIVAPEIECGAVKVFGAVLDYGVDGATTRTSVLRIVGVGHDLEFVNCVHIRRDFPLAGVSAGLLRDWGAVQSELVIKA